MAEEAPEGVAVPEWGEHNMWVHFLVDGLDILTSGVYVGFVGACVAAGDRMGFICLHSAIIVTEVVVMAIGFLKGRHDADMVMDTDEKWALARGEFKTQDDDYQALKEQSIAEEEKTREIQQRVDELQQSIDEDNKKFEEEVDQRFAARWPQNHMYAEFQKMDERCAELERDYPENPMLPQLRAATQELQDNAFRDFKADERLFLFADKQEEYDKLQSNLEEQLEKQNAAQAVQENAKKTLDDLADKSHEREDALHRMDSEKRHVTDRASVTAFATYAGVSAAWEAVNAVIVSLTGELFSIEDCSTAANACKWINIAVSVANFILMKAPAFYKYVQERKRR